MSIEAEPTAEAAGGHVVQFYERDDELVVSVATYLRDGLLVGDTAVVVATGAHRRSFEAALAGAGLDVAAARRERRLILLDADETMTQVLVDDRPQAAAFDAVVGGMIRSASPSGARLRVYGEMVTLLWDRGQVNAAIELEELWNDLGCEVAFSLYCAYRVEAAALPAQLDHLRAICHLHTAVLDPLPDVAEETLSSAATGLYRRFEADVDAPRAARRFVVESLERLGRDDLADDAAVVVTELATNAILHARTPFTVRISAVSDTVRISVRDASCAPPVPRDPGPAALSGRGMSLVAGIADRWGTLTFSRGKTVWAELRL